MSIQIIQQIAQILQWFLRKILNFFIFFGIFFIIHENIQIFRSVNSPKLPIKTNDQVMA